MDWGYPVGEGPSEEIPGPFRFSGKASEIPPVLLFKKVGKELLLHDLIRPDRLIRSQDRKSDRSRQQVGKLKTQVIGLLVYKHHIERIPSPFIPVFFAEPPKLTFELSIFILAPFLKQKMRFLANDTFIRKKRIDLDEPGFKSQMVGVFRVFVFFQLTFPNHHAPQMKGHLPDNLCQFRHKMLFLV